MAFLFVVSALYLASEAHAIEPRAADTPMAGRRVQHARHQGASKRYSSSAEVAASGAITTHTLQAGDPTAASQAGEPATIRRARPQQTDMNQAVRHQAASASSAGSLLAQHRSKGDNNTSPNATAPTTAPTQAAPTAPPTVTTASSNTSVNLSTPTNITAPTASPSNTTVIATTATTVVIGATTAAPETNATANSTVEKHAKEKPRESHFFLWVLVFAMVGIGVAAFIPGSEYQEKLRQLIGFATGNGKDDAGDRPRPSASRRGLSVDEDSAVRTPLSQAGISPPESQRARRLSMEARMKTRQHMSPTDREQDAAKSIQSVFRSKRTRQLGQSVTEEPSEVSGHAVLESNQGGGDVMERQAPVADSHQGEVNVTEGAAQASEFNGASNAAATMPARELLRPAQPDEDSWEEENPVPRFGRSTSWNRMRTRVGSFGVFSNTLDDVRRQQTEDLYEMQWGNLESSLPSPSEGGWGTPAGSPMGVEAQQPGADESA